MTTTPAQPHEIETWLGDDHDLTPDQVETLRAAADTIAARYPDPDDQAERKAALATARRIVTEDPALVVAELADARRRAREALALSTAGLWQAAVMTVDVGVRGRKHSDSENAFAVRAGVDRKTVRTWLGK
jgi:hypothetical protein